MGFFLRKYALFFLRCFAIGAPLSKYSVRNQDLAIITPHISTFDSAHKRILNLLENDAYRRFLEWDVYKQLESESQQEQQQQQQQAGGRNG